MNRGRIAVAVLALCAVAAVPAPSPDAVAARSFLDLLRPELRADALLELGSPDRMDWSYLPGRRAGITLQRMNAAERRAAHALLRASLSGSGYEKTTGVIELEGILREIETFGFRRDPELYTLAIFGAPSGDAPWGWRFEGHHLSLNFTSADGRIVSSSPAFFGANPARVPEGPRQGWRVLGAEEDTARRLLASLDAGQRRLAILAGSAPGDILFGPGRKSVPEPAGIAAGDLTPPQRALLDAVVNVYLGAMRDDAAEIQRQKIAKAGAAAIRFAWAGGTEPGRGHYYRVQGPTFLIEYDNTQGGANHVHSVFRDLQDDFGGDLLGRHRARHPH